MIYLGFDPGGFGAFGCCLLDMGRHTATLHTALSVDDAVRWAGSVAPSEVHAAGIDTLLFWQSTASAWRGGDLYLRERYPARKNSVVSSNGLYGSMSVQGAVLAYRLRERWPEIGLTETHPKVLWHHLKGDLSYPRDWSGGMPPVASDWLDEICLSSTGVADDHQFDALLSAWAANQGFAGSWGLDLAQNSTPGQIAPNVSLVPNVHYFWPD